MNSPNIGKNEQENQCIQDKLVAKRLVSPSVKNNEFLKETQSSSHTTLRTCLEESDELDRQERVCRSSIDWS